ncbi:right-handed parallel beta-helix repeat-containing protein [uncultured Thiothrix sp.]|jgi:parallel beta-helix repeat protein|uniref:right-handed parallel beta-helix repeat-containing protein n=1 Tax=uncultured Thiothrix sp. TaxID=223185 RepID=UPI0026222B95|nr:right-handed parallel beta-helix repeat-containing protein [uncultured Thiothrix sp.]HMT92580.1 right-handed parallel beta-helix repeat-containing protein [Thiolinea sp.]
MRAELKKNILCLFMVTFLLSACKEEIDQGIDNLFEDKNYSADINWPSSQNSNCPIWKAGETVNVSASIVLPSNCTYNQVTFKITKPNIEFDCNGSVLNGLKQIGRHRFGDTYSASEAPRAIAFQISSAEASSTRVQNVSIRNCQIINYIHGVDVKYELKTTTIAGLRQGLVSEDVLRRQAPTNVKVINSKIINSHGTGIYIYRYVSNFQLENSSLKGSGGSGIYLDAGTELANINYSIIEGNGFSTYDETTRIRSARRSDEAKREGIAIDGSTQNTIESNSFKDNADGGIYLYKNCWENYTNTKEWPRLNGSNDNIIAKNSFFNETVGVWIAERADRDLASFNCGDPLALQEGSKKFYIDYANATSVIKNKFDLNQTAIKVMDNNSVIEGNTFSRIDGYDIDVGSRVRAKIGNAISSTNIGSNTFSKINSVRFQYDSQ